jgi:hypothetical protein
MEAASDVPRRRGVVPERAGLGRTEDVLKVGSRFDWGLRQPRHAVHGIRYPHAMPVNAGRLGKLVDQPDPQLFPAPCPQHRAGDRALVAPERGGGVPARAREACPGLGANHTRRHGCSRLRVSGRTCVGYSSAQGQHMASRQHGHPWSPSFRGRERSERSPESITTSQGCDRREPLRPLGLWFPGSLASWQANLPAPRNDTETANSRPAGPAWVNRLSVGAPKVSPRAWRNWQTRGI